MSGRTKNILLAICFFVIVAAYAYAMYRVKCEKDEQAAPVVAPVTTMVVTNKVANPTFGSETYIWDNW